MNRVDRQVSLLVFMLMFIACGTKVDLPTETTEFDPIFGAGDTSYIRISPDWDAANGYSFDEPWDIIVGADGYLFVADREQAAIHVINAAGETFINDDYGNHFGALSSLSHADGTLIHPVAIHQDSRLNLFIADSSNQLMVWNQYLNNVGVEAMASRLQYSSPQGEQLWISDLDSMRIMSALEWTLDSTVWSGEDLEQWLTPRAFWDANDPQEATEIARYFIDPENIHVTGVSASGDLCYVGDVHSNAILELQYIPVGLLMTGNGESIYVYGGTIAGRHVSPGTGNGTVNDPRGMIHGRDGALFYTQWGENFAVHKVGGSAGFEYGEDDIMEIERFSLASDVSLDPRGNIYIADTGHDRVQQFNAAGRFTFNIGMSRVLVDSSYVDSILVGSEYETMIRDSTYQVEVADILDAPRSVAVDANGVVYIADTNQERVMRYRLSTELDYDTEDQ